MRVLTKPSDDQHISYTSEQWPRSAPVATQVGCEKGGEDGERTHKGATLSFGAFHEK